MNVFDIDIEEKLQDHLNRENPNLFSSQNL